MKKQKIYKLLEKAKIEGFIEDIKKKNLNKYILIIKNKKKKIIKLYLSKISNRISLNEKKGYKFLKRKIFSNIHFPNFTLKKYSNNFSAGIIDYIDGNNIKYFSILKLQNFISKILVNKKKINLIKYEKIIIENFKKIYSLNIENEIQYYFTKLKKFKKKDIFISFSHGDFVSWNVICNKKKYYIYDLEYFSKKRIYIYDIIHWLITPIFLKILSLKRLNLNFTNLFIFYLKLVFKLFNIKCSHDELKIYLFLFFLEKKYFYKFPNYIKFKKDLISKDQIYKSLNLSKMYNDQLKYFEFK